MSKPMLVTWPFVMLLLDWWPLRRGAKCEVGGEKTRKLEATAGGRGSTCNYQPATFDQLVLEKIPFFALVAMTAAA